jgi:hypothetical protein
LLRYLLRAAMQRSALARALFEPGNIVLPGMSTYLMKIGPDNLVPPFDSTTDRQFSSMPGITSIRLRLQQTAKLLASGIEAQLSRRPGVPLHLLNIGGGSAIDSLNALILLRRAAPALMQRPTVIHLLDPDSNGPFFAAQALNALRSPGAALAGHDVRLVHTAYNWDRSESLQQLVRQLAAEDSIIAASSEGALFEYASDESVVANLKALFADGNGASLVAGSVTRGDEATRRALAFSPFKLVPRGAAVFARLITGTGFHVARVEEAVLSDQVLLSA